MREASVRPGQSLRKELLAKRTGIPHKAGRKPKGRMDHPPRQANYGASFELDAATEFFRKGNAPKMSPDQIARQDAQVEMLKKVCK